MTDSGTLRAAGGDPHYTRMCTAELVALTEKMFQPWVEAGTITPQQAALMARAQYEAFRSVLLRLAWFYYTAGGDAARRKLEKAVVLPPQPILPAFDLSSFPPENPSHEKKK